MDDFVDFLYLIVCALVLVVVWAVSATSIALDCDNIGGFYVGSKVYECKRKQ